MTMQLRNFSQAFLEIADQHPNRVFAETPDGPLTFAMLSAQADAMAAMLAAKGLRPGAHVMVMMANSPVSLALVQGILRAGFIWVPTNPALVSEGLAHAIRLVEADAIFCDADILPVIEACGARPSLGALVLDSIPDAVEPPVQRAVPTPDDLAALMFTSGTTGPSKAVMVTHKMLELAGHAVIHCTDLAPGDRFYMWEPFYHIGGAQLLILPFLAEVDTRSATTVQRQPFLAGSLRMRRDAYSPPRRDRADPFEAAAGAVRSQSSRADRLGGRLRAGRVARIREPLRAGTSRVLRHDRGIEHHHLQPRARGGRCRPAASVVRCPVEGRGRPCSRR